MWGARIKGTELEETEVFERKENVCLRMKNRKLIFQELFVDELKNRSRLGSVSVSLFFFLLNEILAKRL